MPASDQRAVKTPRRENQTTSETAAEWLSRLAEGRTEDHVACLDWLRKSPRHVEELLFAAATWRQLKDWGAAERMSVESIVAQAVSTVSESNVVALSGAPTVPPVRRKLRLAQGVIATAAMLVIAIASGLAWWVFARDTTYVTAIGEQRTIRLKDGSVLFLNTDTRARVHYTAEARDIDLLEGEALFIVAHNPSQPFRVHTEDALIQAVGTQFNVRRLATDTRVTVIEGRVRVARELLSAGEEALIPDRGVIVKRKPADVSQTIAWRQRRLVFNAERLEVVVQEMNRYGSRRFRIEGDEARNTRLTATVDVDDPESLIRFLREYAGLSVQLRNEEFVLEATAGNIR